MKSTTGFFAMTLAAAGFLVAPVAQAQDKAPPAPPPSAPGATAAPIPDSKLDAAAAAAKRVSGMRDSFEQKLAQAPAADKKRVIDEANDAMTKAVTEQGLSIDEFENIMQVAQNDPVVRNKLIQRMK